MSAAVLHRTRRVLLYFYCESLIFIKANCITIAENIIFKTKRVIKKNRVTLYLKRVHLFSSELIESSKLETASELTKNCQLSTDHISCCYSLENMNFKLSNELINLSLLRIKFCRRNPTPFFGFYSVTYFYIFHD